MSHLLFPSDNSRSKGLNARLKPTEIPRQLFYIIRAATDAVEALELFLELLLESSYVAKHDAATTPGFFAFDAHVGDTACQLRACMLLEVIEQLRRSDACARIVPIRATIANLSTLLTKAQQLVVALLELDWNQMRSGGLEQLGIPKSGLTLDELLFNLEWKDIDTSVFKYDSSSASSQESLLCSASSRASSESIASLGSEAFAVLECSPDERWRPSDWRQVVRFLVYSYILSKYKQLIACHGVYRATLKSEDAMKMGQSLVKCDFGKQFVKPNKRAIEEEFLSLQRCISSLSCGWLESKARSSWSVQPGLHSLLKDTVRTSAKGISSTSSYVGYLVLRSLWAEQSTPMIITTTRFCSAGFHTNHFRVTLHTRRDGTDATTRSQVLPKVAWQITRFTGKELLCLQDSMEPHMMISANSIEGHTSDYLERLPTAYRHVDGACGDNEKHCNDMLASDQDRIVRAIFSEHRHYAFELSGEEACLGESVVVQRLMDETVPGLSAVWEQSKREAVTLGTGPSLKLCMWQHVALESPARFLARIQKSTRPWVISDPLAKPTIA